MAPVDNSLLVRWRSLDLTQVLLVITNYAKRDVTFIPDKDSRTERWHATYGDREFELLLTGTKFWDTRAKVGGGGAVDLCVHLTGANFKGAVKLLSDAGI